MFKVRITPHHSLKANDPATRVLPWSQYAQSLEEAGVRFLDQIEEDIAQGGVVYVKELDVTLTMEGDFSSDSDDGD